MIKLKIMQGLQDQFIKQKVITLYQKHDRTSLDDLFKKVVDWETARKAAEIGGESSANGAYGGGGNRPKREGKKPDSSMKCGDKSHPGGNTKAIRKTKNHQRRTRTHQDPHSQSKSRRNHQRKTIQENHQVYSDQVSNTTRTMNHQTMRSLAPEWQSISATPKKKRGCRKYSAEARTEPYNIMSGTQRRTGGDSATQSNHMPNWT